MDHFQYQAGHLFAEQTSLADIAAEVGTPCYVYSRATLERHWHAFDDALGDYPHRICYAVKANGNLAVLNLLARLGSGFDIVSGGELQRVIAAGGDPARSIFSGVGKQDWEIRLALASDIDCFNIESEDELELISDIAGEQGRQASVAVRINPDVDARTHPYISTGLRENKFGLAPEQAMQVYARAAADPNLVIKGVACHIGSQLVALAPYRDALERLLEFVDQLQDRGIALHNIDFGGGLGVRYADEQPPSPAEYCRILRQKMQQRDRPLSLTIEPGRAIAGNAGILLTRVTYLKSGAEADFCIVDAGMNDLIRPALYQAYQQIVEVDQTIEAAERVYDVVGPICESSDFLGKKRRLKIRRGGLLAVRTAGAYGAVMSSNYNARPRPAEVMVDGANWQLVRQRERLADLYAGEQILTPA